MPAGPVLQHFPLALRRQFTLAGGDDYELCFTAPVTRRAEIIAAAASVDTVVTRIGKIDAEPGVRFLDEQRNHVHLSLQSFDHFTSP